MRHKPISCCCSISRTVSSPEQMILDYMLLKAHDRHGLLFCLLVILSDDWGGTESRFIYDVSRDETNARRLLRRLADNTVTPCALTDVIADCDA